MIIYLIISTQYSILHNNYTLVVLRTILFLKLKFIIVIFKWYHWVLLSLITTSILIISMFADKVRETQGMSKLYPQNVH